MVLLIPRFFEYFVYVFSVFFQHLLHYAVCVGRNFQLYAAAWNSNRLFPSLPLSHLSELLLNLDTIVPQFQLFPLTPLHLQKDILQFLLLFN